MSKSKKHNHLTSLRLPTELHEWLVEYAKQLRTTPAYIYRHALWKFKENSQIQ